MTTKTSLLNGFEHDSSSHQYTFFNPQDHKTKPTDAGDGNVSTIYGTSLNTLGYSPIGLGTYLAMIAKVVAESPLPVDEKSRKPFIISVTGSAEAVKECYEKIQQTQITMPNPLCMEITLSCPNIPDRPPPAYSGESLTEYLTALSSVATVKGQRRVAVGIKTPPYTYHDQFKTLIDALLAARTPNVRSTSSRRRIRSARVLFSPKPMAHQR